MEPGHQRIPFDDNRKPFLTALSYVDGQTAVPLFADPATGHLLVTSSGGSGGTQYIEGATTSPATGTTFLGRYQASPSGVSTDGGLYTPLMDNFHQLKVVTVGTASSNITQFGGNNVVTGTGVSGSGIPRVTISSDSFPTTQAISATTLPLPTGAATSANQTTELSTLSTISTNQTNGSQQIQGNIAGGSSDSGNPVKAGAVYNSTKPTYTTGQRADLQTGSRGSLAVQITSVDAILGATVAGSGDTMAAQNGLSVINFQELYNGSSFDRQRNNITAQLIAAGTTTTQTNVTLTTYNARSLVVVASITAGAGSIVVAINGTTTNGYVYPLLTSTSLSGVSVTPLRIGIGLTPSANAVANDVVPRNVQITVTVTGSITYGVDYTLGL